ncbi:MAG: aminotransferase class I/II-fold pyridoxal phosphate-dependent enzyme [Candidatus Hydrogenedens sp.]|jgi:aspartate aminotransferase/aminotransferase|nr:aminotransferase class I/II-fold pyridoxal phosphate-dependent enzyme [Candidatus Hydrogenedens sp.]
MSFLAERMNAIDASGIRKIFALAAKMKDPINLSIGQPDYDVDQLCKDEACNQIQAGFNAYTQTWGIDELREGAAEYYDRKFGAELKNVMITGGVSGGLFLALMATVNPGDEVICADPFFVMYKHLVNLLGGKAVTVNTFPDFKLTAERVEAAITPRTKALIVNTPANPTGVTLNGAELDSLAAVAKKHDLLVISDEIYESLQYDEEPATMVGRYDNVLLLNGFSKNMAMTGWRLGYAGGPEGVIQAMNTLQQYTFVCAPSFAQKAAVLALKADMTEKVDAYRRKRDLVYNGLKDTFHCVKPGGAFYIYPRTPDGDGDAFVKKAIENNVLIIPGSVFSDNPSCFRISFAAPDETIKRGCEILKSLV